MPARTEAHLAGCAEVALGNQLGHGRLQDLVAAEIERIVVHHQRRATVAAEAVAIAVAGRSAVAAITASWACVMQNTQFITMFLKTAYWLSVEESAYFSCTRVQLQKVGLTLQLSSIIPPMLVDAACTVSKAAGD